MAKIQRREFVFLLGGAVAVCPRAAPAQQPEQAGVLTKSQLDALSAYNDALNGFREVLRERRGQLNSNQPLPSLPGQALYLARIRMMSAYKDFTDVLPSKIGRSNKFGIPPAYFDADSEPLIDEYRAVFDILEAPPANAQSSDTPFKDVVDLGNAIARAKGLDAPNSEVAGQSAWASSLLKQMANKTSAMPAPILTKEAYKQAPLKTRMVRRNGRR